MGEIADELIEKFENGFGLYYVVWKGHKPGIYITWEECKKQVHKFPGAAYKSFECYYEEAVAILESGKKQHAPSVLIKDSLSVDAACASNPGPLEFRGVYTKTKKILFARGPYADGTNNVGEFLAIVLGLAYLKSNKSEIPIYTDSQTAISWVNNKKANTGLARTDKNKELFESISKAEKLLRENTYPNQILKWDTRNWGEIGADYGRKK